MVSISQKRFQTLKAFESSQGIATPTSGRGFPIPLFLIVFLLMIIMVLMFAFAVPVNSVMLVNLADGVDQILEQGQPIIDSIVDSDVKDAINDAIGAGINAQSNTIEVNSALYRWGWVFFIIILFLVIFLITNSKTEFSKIGIS